MLGRKKRLNGQGVEKRELCSKISFSFQKVEGSLIQDRNNEGGEADEGEECSCLFQELKCQLLSSVPWTAFLVMTGRCSSCKAGETPQVSVKFTCVTVWDKTISNDQQVSMQCPGDVTQVKAAEETDTREDGSQVSQAVRVATGQTGHPGRQGRLVRHRLLLLDFHGDFSWVRKPSFLLRSRAEALSTECQSSDAREVVLGEPTDRRDNLGRRGQIGWTSLGLVIRTRSKQRAFKVSSGLSWTRCLRLLF